MNALFKKTGLFFFLVLVLVSFSGCVSSEKYQMLESQYDLCRKDLSQAKADADALAMEKDELEEIKTQMIQDLETEISEKSVKIQMLEESLRMTAVEKLFFDSGSAAVKPEGRAILDKIAQTLKTAENMEIHVVGHADELPPGEALSKKYPSNWELSANRATAIIHILQWGYEIDPKRMVAQGVAHYRPLVMETAENRSQNRAVEIFLTVISEAE